MTASRSGARDSTSRIRADLDKCLRDDLRNRRRVRRAEAAVENCNFSEDLTGFGMGEGEFASFRCQHRQAHATFGDQVDFAARVAAAEHNLARSKLHLPHLERDAATLVSAEATEKRGHAKHVDKPILGHALLPTRRSA